MSDQICMVMERFALGGTSPSSSDSASNFSVKKILIIGFYFCIKPAYTDEQMIELSAYAIHKHHCNSSQSGKLFRLLSFIAH